MTRIGDIFEIPVRDMHRAYGQYIFKDRQQGPLIQVFDLITTQPNIDIDDIQNAKPLFPPVITGLNAAIRTKLWNVVGNLPVRNFVYPKFVSAHYDEKTGEAYRWFIWDGETYIDVGTTLSDEQKKLEYLIVWSPYDVMTRIETGEYPYPYGELIKHNKFVPLR
jgi:hypothetical protein